MPKISKTTGPSSVDVPPSPVVDFEDSLDEADAEEVAEEEDAVLAEGEDDGEEDEGEGEPLATLPADPPARNASTEDWREFAGTRGVHNPEQYTRQELIDWWDELDEEAEA